MSTAAESKAAARASGTLPPAALLFELEGVVLPLRKSLFDVAAQCLGERRVQLDPAAFSRCTGPVVTLASQLQNLFGLDGESADLAQAMNERLLAQLASGKMDLSAGVDKVLKVAAERGLPAAVLTGLPEAVAQAAFNCTALEGRGIHLYVFGDEEKTFPRADAWLKVAKALGKTPRFCVAFGSSHAACKSALSAGMRTVAVPDAFTGFHDFGGADMILDSWEDISATDLIDALVPPLH